MCCVDRLNPQPKVSVETWLGNVCLLRSSRLNRSVVDPSARCTEPTLLLIATNLDFMFSMK